MLLGPRHAVRYRLRDALKAPAAVFEVHPEVSFTVMNGDKPIPEPKKVTAAFTRWACGVAKNFWRDKTLLRAFWRQNHRLGRL
jgi:predicted RNase H-like nuclease